jgi:glycosyltransferase involved in cell wall biosynthesis
MRQHQPSVFIDASICIVQRNGGINRVLHELLQRLPAFGIPVHVQAPETGGLPVSSGSLYGFPRSQPMRLAWHMASHRRFRRSGADVYLGTYYDPRPRNCLTSVVLVYDMIHELMPVVSQRWPRSWVDGVSLRRFLRRKRQAVVSADYVIAISQHTRRDLLRLYPELSPAKVSVHYLAASPTFSLGSAQKAASDRYILFVGRRDGYKNFRSLLAAFAGCAPLYEAFELRVVSSNPWTDEELALLGPARDRIILMSCVDDVELAELYRGATVFVYPSLYEGFGLPILEAMACGTPVICCRRASIPEVAGDAVEYFDPERPGDLSRALQEVCFSEPYQARLHHAGLARCTLFSWDRFATGLVDVLRQTA